MHGPPRRRLDAGGGRYIEVMNGDISKSCVPLQCASAGINVPHRNRCKRVKQCGLIFARWGVLAGLCSAACLTAGERVSPPPHVPGPGHPGIAACLDTPPAAQGPGYTPWVHVYDWPWVGDPRRESRVTSRLDLGSETVQYVYNGPVPVPCNVPRVLTAMWRNERSVTHSVAVSGSFSLSLGIETQAEIGIKRLLAARTTADAGSMAQIEGGWTGTWVETIARQEEVQAGICTELERRVSVERVEARWKTPVGRTLQWHACNPLFGSCLSSTTICEVEAYKGDAVGYANRIIDFEVRLLRDCPLQLCP